MWRQHHYQGKPTWSSMHSSCNFPDAPRFWFRLCVLACFFSPQVFYFWVGMTGRGGNGAGKDEGGRRSKVLFFVSVPVTFFYLGQNRAGRG